MQALSLASKACEVIFHGHRYRTPRLAQWEIIPAAFRTSETAQKWELWGRGGQKLQQALPKRLVLFFAVHGLVSFIPN